MNVKWGVPGSGARAPHLLLVGGLLALTPVCAPLWADDAPVKTTEVTPTPAQAALTADAVQEAFVRVAERIKPSVVTIYVERAPKLASTLPDPTKPGAKPDPKNPPGAPNKTPKNDPDDDEDDPFDIPFGPRDPHERRTSLGTGMVVRPDGYILTNNHVVKGATFVRAYFNADSERPDRAAARVIAVDPENDLAIIKVDRTNLKPIEWADSDKVRIGEWSIAVGSPFDQAQSVTVGIVSAKGRHLDGSGKPSLPDYIQTDASINPGNSGGPLVNLDGKVIGINTAILSPSRFNVGIGFSLPSNTIKGVLPTLLEGKKVTRGFLGIQYVPLETEVAREFGVEGGMQIGAMVKNDSPAAKAGLQVDDIITAVDGKVVLGSDEFRRTVTGRAPGAKVTLTVMRPQEGVTQPRDVVVTLGDWAVGNDTQAEVPVIAELPAGTKLGLEVENVEKLSALEKDLFGATTGARGLFVTDVIPGSPGDDAQVGRGLRIVRARVSGGVWQDTPNKVAYERMEKALPPGARVLLQFKDRDDISVYKVLIMPAPPAKTDKPATSQVPVTVKAVG